MNRGNIPGYYFDEEKKKYFKIQANHKTPADAKYSKTNAERARNESKRRKVEDVNRRALRSQTVTRSRLLHDPLIGGTGLLREQGGQSTLMRHQGESLCRGLTGNGVYRFETNCEDSTLWDVHQFHNHVAVTMSYRTCNTSPVVFHYERGTNEQFAPVYCIWKAKRSLELGALRERLVATRSTTISGTPYVLACSSGSGASNIRFVNIGIADPRRDVWKVPDELNSCTINQTTHDVAFTGSSLVAVRSMLDGDKLSWIALPEYVEGSAVEWVDSNTVAFGSSKSIYGKKQKVTRNHAVMLWDTRVNSNASADGTALRLMSSRRITGIERSNASSNNLVVSTNYSIELHDLRNLRKDQPLLSFDHKSEGMETSTSIYDNDLIAAIDERQRVQIYSLLSGT
jgi:hypothetical protein